MAEKGCLEFFCRYFSWLIWYIAYYGHQSETGIVVYQFPEKVSVENVKKPIQIMKG